MTNGNPRRVAYRKSGADSQQTLVDQEWLVTNGLGGYASGSLAGVITRGFHGYLVAALPTPLGRIMMLNDLIERVEIPNGISVQLSGEERVNAPLKTHGAEYLEEFRLDDGIPVWVFRFGDFLMEKRVIMVHRQNTVHVNYRLVQGEGMNLTLRPSMNFRPHEAPVNTPLAGNYAFTVIEDTFEIASETKIPPLRLMLHGQSKSLTMDRTRFHEVIYRIEESRGYAARGDLWSPGYFSVRLTPEYPVTLVASAESWEAIRAVTPEYAMGAETLRRKRLLARATGVPTESTAEELVLAADQFIIVPEGRGNDSLRARAAGDDVRSIIAGYPWFTDWGRDTMIALEGLTLATGRRTEAGYILRTFSHYVRRGLIPNMFPEGHDEGLYHTADATLWFFHAIARYLAATDDQLFLSQVLPQLQEIIHFHLKGTDFGISVDPEDGLLRQGAPGYQLTWMDAKVDGWVVTPRRGKAVEINALWYNALRYMTQWLGQTEQPDKAKEMEQHAQRCHDSFQKRFWYEEGGYLYDVVDGEDGDDPALRPNQLFAISPDFPVLAKDKWRPVMECVERDLLTPYGLRSLSPRDKSYKAKYFGNLRDRDAAYHQGTVWPWLIGPYIDAWIKLHPDELDQAHDLLNAFDERLMRNAIGSIGEIFDAEPPYTHRGCVAQAWSVAEVLRCLVKIATLKNGQESRRLT
ncbi:MAG: amylo-alpha-1,6-glucosidase [Candidatus Acidiferrum sp.]